jgi:hypothetical protein
MIHKHDEGHKQLSLPCHDLEYDNYELLHLHC